VSPRVFLHVGSPKTGTTFLQNVLWSQREIAQEQGVHLPMNRFLDHYFAALDLRGVSDQPHHPAAALGMWDRMVNQTKGRSDTVLVSHELFAPATAEQAERAVRAWGPRAEVHVVLTARDLARQITAEWQEHVKHRSTATFPEFVRSLRADEKHKTWFWQVQDSADVLERWGSVLPASRVHVVTVPPAGGASTLLWERFAGLLGLDPARFDLEQGRSNSSLSLDAAEVLRRVNAELGDRLPLPGPYPRVVKNVLAHQIMAQHPGAPVRLGADDAAFARAESQKIAERLAASGVDVIGDLSELVPPEPAIPDADYPDADYTDPDVEALLDESVTVIADLLVALNQRTQGADLLRDARERPVRFALSQAANHHPLLGQARRGYRRLRRWRHS
jgi:hypothetical protein